MDGLIVREYSTQTGTIAEGDYALIKGVALKYANIVDFMLESNVNITPSSNGWIVVGTLPQGYRPTYQFDLAGIDNVGDGSLHFRINTAGTISYYGYSGQTVKPFVSGCFVIV